jgi:hypothetical protein
MLHRFLVGALLAAKSFDEPYKSLIGGFDIGVRNDDSGLSQPEAMRHDK